MPSFPPFFADGPLPLVTAVPPNLFFRRSSYWHVPRRDAVFLAIVAVVRLEPPFFNVTFWGPYLRQLFFAARHETQLP